MPDKRKREKGTSSKPSREQLTREALEIVRSRFQSFGRGWDAFNAGWSRKPPDKMTPSEKTDWRKGYDAAAADVALESEHREELESL
jgi:hypothetical protein